MPCEKGNGKLIFRYGTMGSAKSAHLLITGFNYEERGRSVLYLKPSVDTREEEITSRIGIHHKCLRIASLDGEEDNDEEISLVNIHFDFFEYILIDEAQFLKKEEVDYLALMADTLDVTIICYGLRTDASTLLFSGSKRLFELADEIEEIPSICSCGRKTIVNGLKDGEVEGKFILPNKKINIGANDKYQSVCRHCWNECLKNV